MSIQTRDLNLLAVAVFTTVGCAYYYVAAVVDENRALSRAALAFLFFGVVAAVFGMRVLL